MLAHETEDVQTDQSNDASAGLPDYAPQIAAFHQAFAPELRDVIDSLPLKPQMRVLDLGCGDGFYLRLLAEHLLAPGSVVGLDQNADFLAVASRNQELRSATCKIDLVAGTLAELPLESGAFDMIWCAQSLYSFPEPVEALRQMAQAIAPGGTVAVLENDTLHQIFLPWPAHLEIALRTAELEVYSEDSEQPEKFYVGRCLPAVFAAAGLRPLKFKTQCIDRSGPLDGNLQQFLKFYLGNLEQRIGRRLPRKLQLEFKALIDADGPGYLPRQPHFTMSWVNVIAWGERSSERQ